MKPSQQDPKKHSKRPFLFPRRIWRLLNYFTLGILTLLLILGAYLYSQFNSPPNPINNYSLYQQASFHQLDYYPVVQSVNPPQEQWVGDWIGRLIYHRQTNNSDQHSAQDSVQLEVFHAPSPYEQLVGQRVPIRWQKTAQTQEFLTAVTQDLEYGEAVKAGQQGGNLHPDRLQNLKAVDPLESLAAARPQDDVWVKLNQPVWVNGGLEIATEPTQISGRIYLVGQFIHREVKDRNTELPAYLIRHYNPNSQKFDGAEERILLPQVPRDRNGIQRSTPQDIEKSPLNEMGWYLYGSKNRQGIFVVQAIAPRALLRLQPQETRLQLSAIKTYLNREIWQDTTRKKGTGSSVLLDPHSPDSPTALQQWKEGDRAIVLHTFGGIGGKNPEPQPLGVVTGHFAYGIAQVIRDPMTQELRFDIEYQQVYAHNPDGIIAGPVTWETYMGDLQRGWLGNRPVSDVIVKLDAVTQDYDFDGIKLSPLDEFKHQLQIMMARYRIGDGTGASTVTPSTSCVQDANQALFITLKRIQDKISQNPQISTWLNQHPNHPQTQRFQRLVKLGKALENQLVPLKIVRSDWQKNSQTLSGTRPAPGLLPMITTTFMSWRTLLPRRAHDEIALLLLNQGATLWSLRTNQIGGFDPDIVPNAPTALLGHRSH